jgi:pullulanase/glycogen debranching enzyme
MTVNDWETPFVKCFSTLVYNSFFVLLNAYDQEMNYKTPFELTGSILLDTSNPKITNTKVNKITEINLNPRSIMMIKLN